MLLKITTERPGARDLSYLLHKHPDRVQAVELVAGKAHIFYPRADDRQCTVCLVLDINPIKLMKGTKGSSNDFALAHYVNDRPYVASSYMSVALSKAFSTAMNGACKEKPDLVDEEMPFEVEVAVLPAPKGGEALIRRLFEPLGYSMDISQPPLDDHFPEWGSSRYFAITLHGTQKLKDLLSHLYVLIPVLDNRKHYWVSRPEVEKLLQKGEGWLQTHPENHQITKRYLMGIGSLTRSALDRLLESDLMEESTEEDTPPSPSEKKESLHSQRLNFALEEIRASRAEKVIDLGCGDGKLLKLLLKEKQFTKILGMDVSFRSLEKAAQRLHYREMAPKQKERIELIQGALTYRDKRLEGFEAAAIIEVIEHLDLDRLKSFERSIFEFATPDTVVLTTPNREYNQLFESMGDNELRHTDHRFEWTREEFTAWANGVCEKFGYRVAIKPIGPLDEKVGAPSQGAIFKRQEHVE